MIYLYAGFNYMLLANFTVYYTEFYNHKLSFQLHALYCKIKNYFAEYFKTILNAFYLKHNFQIFWLLLLLLLACIKLKRKIDVFKLTKLHFVSNSILLTSFPFCYNLIACLIILNMNTLIRFSELIFIRRWALIKCFQSVIIYKFNSLVENLK